MPPSAEILSDLKDLLVRDFENIESGIYKMPTEIIPSPLAFSKNSYKFFKDLLRVKDRQSRLAVKEFTEEIKDKSLPSYYTQTFHFQTDGYLSQKSADLYDHQVEIVFAGGGDVMRRQALVPLYHYCEERKIAANDKPVTLLDVACGTGRFLRSIKENYPEVRVTGVDLSPFYLKKARENLKDFTHADFVEANSEELPFKDAQFDVVSCIFLFHELPRLVRSTVAREMVRVLKPGGMLIFEESIQLGDKPTFDSSLRMFPQTYHEPYYSDYIQQTIDEIFLPLGLEKKGVDLAFFSKIINYEKAGESLNPKLQIPN